MNAPFSKVVAIFCIINFHSRGQCCRKKEIIVIDRFFFIRYKEMNSGKIYVSL
jgi:hypothetical protein